MIPLCAPARPGVPPDCIEALPARPLDLPTIGQGWQHLGGPAPFDHPHLLDLLDRIHASGAHARLEVASATAEQIASAVSHGLGILRVRLHSLDDAHDSITGIEGSGARARETIELARQHHGLKVEVLAVVCVANATVLPALASWCEDLELHLEPIVPGSPRLAALRLSAKATAKAIASVRLPHLRASAMRGPPLPLRRSAPVPWTPTLHRLLRDEVPQHDLGGGCVVGEHEVDGLQLAAWRCPPIDRPAYEGGPGRDEHRTLPVWQPAGARIGILHPAMTDVPMILLTLPALARALQDRGAEVRWLSAWGAAAEMHPTTSGPARLAAVAAARQAPSPALGDLSDLDVVLAPTWATGAEALANPTRAPDTRVVVADFHMLDGIEGWTSARVPAGTHPTEVDWWPGEHVQVHSCFPGHSRLYNFRNVPQSQILWRPYPLDLQTFTPGPPAHACSHGFAGGNQSRAWPMLLEAAKALHHPVHLYTRHAPRQTLPPSLQWKGTVDLLDFYEALKASRYVVVPVRYRPDVASGITVIAMALAAGRPVITTRTAATMDHVRHGESGILVPHDRPERLAAAMERLHADDALVGHLSAGARRAAERLGVRRWADELLDGGEPVRVVGEGPYYPW